MGSPFPARTSASACLACGGALSQTPFRHSGSPRQAFWDRQDSLGPLLLGRQICERVLGIDAACRVDAGAIRISRSRSSCFGPRSTDLKAAQPNNSFTPGLPAHLTGLVQPRRARVLTGCTECMPLQPYVQCREALGCTPAPTASSQQSTAYAIPLRVCLCPSFGHVDECLLYRRVVCPVLCRIVLRRTAWLRLLSVPSKAPCPRQASQAKLCAHSLAAIPPAAPYKSYWAPPPPHKK